MAKETNIDLIVGCGDYTGGKYAPTCIDVITSKIREAYPTTPFVSVLGNHDYWIMEKKRSMTEWTRQNQRIQEVFARHNVHFLDKDGVLALEDTTLGKVSMVGHSGWYHNPNPPTNDGRWMPMFQVPTHGHMYSTAYSELLTNLGTVPKDSKVIFVSHFGVNKDSQQDWKGGFETFGGDPNIGLLLQNDYACTTFLQGHAHTLRQGPLNWECGSDYYYPKFQVIDI